MANIDLWGVTETGFYRPTIDDIIYEKNRKAKEIFGEDFDTSEQTPQGKFFRINAAAESKLFEIAEQIYYSIFPNTATGLSLDRVCSSVNLNRESARFAAHKIRVYGTQNYLIEAGTLFKNVAGVEFYTSQDATINRVETGQEGTAAYFTDVVVYCTESGTIGNVQNINSTVEVDTDISTVMYLSVVAYGTEIESDPDLRAKFQTVVQGLGTNTDASIKANVLRVAGVNDVIIIDNPTDNSVVVSSSLTIEPKSYAVIVYADDTNINSDIAEAIFLKAPLGIKQSGLEEETVVDNSGMEHLIKFSYVAATTISVVVECDVNNMFEDNGTEEIKQRITDYINNLGIGQEVIYSQLYNYVYDVTGVYKVTKMTINGNTVDIPINNIEIAKVGSIAVTVTGV